MGDKTGIVLVNFKTALLTLACLDSLEEANVNAEVVVICVETHASELEKLRKHQMKVKLIEAENRGFSALNNLGIRGLLKSDCSSIILLNNDTVVGKNFLKPLLKRLKDPTIGMISPLTYFAKGSEYHTESYSKNELGKVIWYAGGVLDMKNVLAWHWGVNEVDHGQFKSFAHTDFATGCCLATRADVINKIGLLDEKFFLYMEDLDWSLRAKAAGYVVGIEPESKIWHVNAGSTGGSGSDTQQYYQAKSRFLFTFKHAGLRSKMAVLKDAITKMKDSVILRRAYWDAILGRYGKNEHKA